MKTIFCKSVFLFIILIANTNLLFSQSTFKALMEGGTRTAPLSIFQHDTTINLFNNIYHYEFSEAGILIKTISFSIGGVLFSNHNYIKSMDNLIFYSKEFSYSLYVAKYNLINKNIIWAKSFSNLANPNASIDTGVYSNILVSASSNIPANKPIVIYSDSLGNLKNSYCFNSQNGMAKFTMQNLDYNFIIGLNIDTLGAVLTKMDTTGNILWCKSFFRPKAAIHSAVQNSDGTITLIGSPDTVSGWMEAGYFHTSPLFLMKIDTAGSVIWCKSFGDSLFSFTNLPLSQLKVEKGGGYIICSTIVNKLLAQSDLVLIRTDANGDTLWTRTHGSDNTNEFGQDVTNTTDGGYVVCGHSDTKQFFWGGYYVIKTDSLGMTASHCQEYSTPFAVNTIIPNDSNVVLTVTTGIVTQGISLVTDTLYPNPPVADGCLLSTVNDFSPAKYKILSYPNPTQGHFKINTGDGHAKIIVTIYDTLGNQLFEKEYPNQKEIEMDLNKMGKGIYTVRIFDVKQARYSKVVVQ